MYVSPDFKTKTALKAALRAGQDVLVYQPNSDRIFINIPANGTVDLEGPHYPKPHTWYATGTMKDGRLVSIK